MSKFNFILLLLFFRNHYDFLSEVCVLAVSNYVLLGPT